MRHSIYAGFVLSRAALKMGEMIQHHKVRSGI
jgi:hypothetical protein